MSGSQESFPESPSGSSQASAFPLGTLGASQQGESRLLKSPFPPAFLIKRLITLEQGLENILLKPYSGFIKPYG